MVSYLNGTSAPDLIEARADIAERVDDIPRGKLQCTSMRRIAR